MNSVEITQLVLQLIVALGILNVWLLRFNKDSKYRGKDASSMEEEFEAYNLPTPVMYVVGGLKILFALGLIGGIFFEDLIRPCAIGIAVLMLGAIVMHVRVGDELYKSFPAFFLMALSLMILFYQ